MAEEAMIIEGKGAVVATLEGEEVVTTMKEVVAEVILAVAGKAQTRGAEAIDIIKMTMTAVASVEEGEEEDRRTGDVSACCTMPLLHPVDCLTLVALIGFDHSSACRGQLQVQYMGAGKAWERGGDPAWRCCSIDGAVRAYKCQCSVAADWQRSTQVLRMQR
jgi:hypothetical protein